MSITRAVVLFFTSEYVGVGEGDGLTGRAEEWAVVTSGN